MRGDIQFFVLKQRAVKGTHRIVASQKQHNKSRATGAKKNTKCNESQGMAEKLAKANLKNAEHEETILQLQADLEAVHRRSVTL